MSGRRGGWETGAGHDARRRHTIAATSLSNYAVGRRSPRAVGVLRERNRGGGGPRRCRFAIGVGLTP